MKKTVLLSIVLFAIFATTLVAAIPTTFNLQGYLANSQGEPVTSTVGMVFNLYDGPASSVPIFVDQLSGGVSVVAGYYNIRIGLPAGIVGIVDDVRGPNYLYYELVVEGVPQGRVPFDAVPYAVGSKYAEEAGYARPIGNAGGILSGTYPNPDINEAALKNVLKNIVISAVPTGDARGKEITGKYPDDLVIAPSAVQNYHIAYNAIRTVHINAGAVTLDKLAEPTNPNISYILKWDAALARWIYALPADILGISLEENTVPRWHDGNFRNGSITDNGNIVAINADLNLPIGRNATIGGALDVVGNSTFGSGLTVNGTTTEINAGLFINGNFGAAYNNVTAANHYMPSASSDFTLASKGYVDFYVQHYVNNAFTLNENTIPRWFGGSFVDGSMTDDGSEVIVNAALLVNGLFGADYTDVIVDNLYMPVAATETTLASKGYVDLYVDNALAGLGSGTTALTDEFVVPTTTFLDGEKQLTNSNIFSRTTGSGNWYINDRSTYTGPLYTGLPDTDFLGYNYTVSSNVQTYINGNILFAGIRGDRILVPEASLYFGQESIAEESGILNIGISESGNTLGLTIVNTDASVDGIGFSVDLTRHDNTQGIAGYFVTNNEDHSKPTLYLENRDPNALSSTPSNGLALTVNGGLNVVGAMNVTGELGSGSHGMIVYVINTTAAPLPITTTDPFATVHTVTDIPVGTAKAFICVFTEDDDGNVIAIGWYPVQ